MQSRDEVVNIVRDAVIETFDLKEEISTDSLSFKEDLKADSIDMVSLSLVLEEEFDDEIEEDQLENLITINHVVDYIMSKQDLNVSK